MGDSRVFVAPVCGDVGLWSGFDEISKIAPSPTSSAGLFPKKNGGGGGAPHPFFEGKALGTRLRPVFLQ